MERDIPDEHEAVYIDIEDFEAELGRRVAEFSSAINPAQAIGSGDIVNSRHREVVKPKPVDPSLRSMEECAMATGRIEIIDQL